jgi:2,4-didehydro-3-deoxy-L-rhamnonate hydrolase
MSLNLLRFDSGSGARWGVVRGADVLPLPAEYTTTAEVLEDGVKAARALLADESAATLPLAAVAVLHPVPDARIICQGANYRTHMLESGMDPSRAFNMLFTKSTASLSGPVDDIVRPPHVQLLDYEVELGLVMGRAVTGPVELTDDDLVEYIGGFVVANDVSARDVQLPQGQWYKGKSYRTFTPVGPYLCVPDPDEVTRWRELRLTLQVNGETRQDEFAGDMVFGPAATITELSHLENLAVGDLILTGTPGGVALQPPPAFVQRVMGLLPDATRWRLFVRAQARSRAYLRPGDRITASIRTDDGRVDLGTQSTTVR